jgi:hypothetical protein
VSGARAFPQWPQKRISGAFSPPHATQLQLSGRAFPQRPQKRISSWFSPSHSQTQIPIVPQV